MAFSLDTVKAAVLQIIEKEPHKLLDIGSGDGKLLAAIAEKFPNTDLHACDYTGAFMKFDRCTLTVANIDIDPLPFPDNSFDVVTITEVIEHLENYHRVIREIHRILTPSGTLIITTPNILNLKSRASFLKTGFWNLFGPLPLDHKNLESTAGHITPVHFYHLSYSLRHAGFSNISLGKDKTQKSSLFLLILLYPMIILWRLNFLRIETKKYQTVNENNLATTKEVNSYNALVGRSILVTAKKTNSDL